ncbi:MAG: hypothetical protein ACRD6W_04530 [Nitrososphaerales archaeon]
MLGGLVRYHLYVSSRPNLFQFLGEPVSDTSHRSRTEITEDDKDEVDRPAQLSIPESLLRTEKTSFSQDEYDRTVEDPDIPASMLTRTVFTKSDEDRLDFDPIAASISETLMARTSLTRAIETYDDDCSVGGLAFPSH